MMDLTDYTGKGFPGSIDQAIADVPVIGIDRQQTQSAVLLCPQTEHALYEGDYSPRKIRYTKGTRPTLESTVGHFDQSTPRRAAHEAMRWTAQQVIHAHCHGPIVPDRGMTEEDLIDSAKGWCNEQSRVFIALCEVMQIPARLCFLFHENLRCSHAATEVFIDGTWAFFDVTFDLSIEKDDGTLAQGRELHGPLRELAHKAYQPILTRHYEHVMPFVNDVPGWNPTDRPDVDRGGDLLGTLGITNYLIDGVERVE